MTSSTTSPLADRPARSGVASRLRSRTGDISVRTKLLGIVAVSVLTTLFVGGTAFVTIDNVYGSGVDLVEEQAQPAIALGATRVAWGHFENSVSEGLFTNTSEGKDAAVRTVDDAAAAALQGLDAYAASAGPEQRAILDNQVRPAVQASVDAWNTQMKPVVTRVVVNEETVLAFVAARAQEFEADILMVSEGLQQIADLDAKDLAHSSAKTRGTRNHSVVLMGGMAVAGAALLVLLGLLTAAGLSKAIDRVRRAMEAFAEGDLTRPIDVTRGDEVGRMATAVVMAQGSLREAITDIASSSHELASQAGDLSDVADALAANASSTSERAAALAETAAEVNASVQAAASGAEQITSSIQEIATSSSQANRAAVEAVTEVSSVSDAVERLSRSTEEISSVVQLISTIAAQTNLLALNATIEAARAGDAGRGFGVVAEEVKTLAQQAAAGADGIAKGVGAIQSDTASAVEAIRRITETIEEVGSFQATIAAAVEEQTVTTGEIAQSVAVAASGSARMADTISYVAEAARSSSEGAVAATGHTERLGVLSRTLNDLVARFHA